MSSKKVYFLMLAVVVLLSGAVIGSVVMGNFYLEKQAKRLNELKVEDKVLEDQQVALTQAKKDLEKYAELEKISKSVVPQDKDQAKAVLEIVEIARATNLNIQSITFPSSSLGTKPTPTGNSSGDGSQAPAQAQTSPVSQAKPVDGIPGVYSLEMKISPSAPAGGRISYYQFLDFLARIENNRRTAQITQIQVTPSSDNRESPFVSFSLSVNIFVKP